MKKIFWIGWLGLLLFEIANVYFIMPMPGSQRMNSLPLAYFLYTWRWVFRAVFGIMVLAGLFRSSWRRKWLLLFPLLLLATVAYFANFEMAADQMFRQPRTLAMANAASSQVDTNRLVIGIRIGDVAKAYPIQFIGYHHQVQDRINGQPVLVTYCTVCRTGRIFEPVVNGKTTRFRLVGMDHFNAMFEDKETHSWWRQATGEAVAGKLKGAKLKELFSTQTTLQQWLQLNPGSLIMQPDPAFVSNYDSTFNYENGSSRKSLTGSDSLSWNEKSWVIGISIEKSRRAYDWNRLKQERLIQDTLGGQPLLLALAGDGQSFFALQRPQMDMFFKLSGDTLYLNTTRFRIDGTSIDSLPSLKPLPAYQEFWHSWRSFQPASSRY
ncbi:MAG: DUF3179 domain-containing protein [Chitinophagaceae bacterium]|nr:DUF3179 domain-containing protein [Chitinophagaceae bacterium]